MKTATDEQIIKLYKSTKNMTVVSTMLGVGYPRIKKALIKHGIEHSLKSNREGYKKKFYSVKESKPYLEAKKKEQQRRFPK